MRTRCKTVFSKLASLFPKLRERFRYDRKLRFALLALLMDVVGYAAVFVLIRQGVMGTLAANITVSKVMAPAGLFMNTFALTGHWVPSRRQASDWFSYWLPSSSVNSAYLTLWVTVVGVEGISARAVAGLTIFPLDYLVKRYIIFGEYGVWLRLQYIRIWTYYKVGGLLKAEYNGPGIFPGPTLYLS